MKNTLLKIGYLLSSNYFQVAFTFLSSGLLAGVFFIWLTHIPALENFFFIPDRKLGHVAQFSWWIASSLFLTLGLLIGFLISLRKAEFIQKFHLTIVRALAACVLISTTMPFLNWFALRNLEVLATGLE